MEDNRKIKIRKALKAMRDASKGIPQQEAPNWDRGRKFVEKIRKDRKIEKELKLDYDLVKKFKKQKLLFGESSFLDISQELTQKNIEA